MTTKEKVLVALAEALKEAFRNVALAILPILIGGINTSTGAIVFDYRVIFAVSLLALLRTVDRYVHIYNSQDKDGQTDRSLGLIRTNW